MMKQSLFISAALLAGSAMTGLGLSTLHASAFGGEAILIEKQKRETLPHLTSTPKQEPESPEPVLVAQATQNEADLPWVIFYDAEGNPVYAARPIAPSDEIAGSLRPQARPSDQMIMQVEPATTDLVQQLTPDASVQSPSELSDLKPSEPVKPRAIAIAAPKAIPAPKPIRQKKAEVKHLPPATLRRPALASNRSADIANPALIGVYR